MILPILSRHSLGLIDLLVALDATKDRERLCGLGELGAFEHSDDKDTILRLSQREGSPFTTVTKTTCNNKLTHLGISRLIDLKVVEAAILHPQLNPPTALSTSFSCPPVPISEMIPLSKRLRFDLHCWLQLDQSSPNLFLCPYEWNHQSQGCLIIRIKEIVPKESLKEKRSLSLTVTLIS